MKKIITLSILAGCLSLSAQDTSSAFSDILDNGDGSYTGWIGTFSPEGDLSAQGFINHEEHGRLYVNASGQDVYLYDANIDALGEAFHGWIYTTRDLHPYFYVYSDPGFYVIYLPGVMGPEPTPRVFLNTVSTSPLMLPKRTSMDIVEVATGAGIFNSLAAALTSADLVETVQMPGPYTVFAPTDDAFAKLDPALVSSLLTDPSLKSTLSDILTYHVVAGEYTAKDLGFDVMDMFNGESTTRYLTTVLGTDLRIDITPFGVMIDNSVMVTMPDVKASNGIVHIVDSVILPPDDIVDTAIGAGLSSLATAVTEAELIETLRSAGPFTVFAPVDAAFAELGEETIATLFDDANIATLQDILLYHVVTSAVYSSEVAPGIVEMANGKMATISTMDGKLYIDGAEIIATDIKTKNGVVHLINKVITPPGE